MRNTFLKGSTSLAIREMQIKIILRFHCFLVRMIKLKKTKHSTCQQGAGEGEGILIAGGSEKWHDSHGNKYGVSPKTETQSRFSYTPFGHVRKGF